MNYKRFAVPLGSFKLRHAGQNPSLIYSLHVPTWHAGQNPSLIYSLHVPTWQDDTSN